MNYPESEGGYNSSSYLNSKENAVVPIKWPVRIIRWSEKKEESVCLADLPSEESVEIIRETFENTIVQKVNAAHGWTTVTLRRLEKLEKEDPDNPIIQIIKPFIETVHEKTTETKATTNEFKLALSYPQQVTPVKRPYGSKRRERILDLEKYTNHSHNAA